MMIVDSRIDQFDGRRQTVDVHDEPKVLVRVDVRMEDAAILIVDSIMNEPICVVGEVYD